MPQPHAHSYMYRHLSQAMHVAGSTQLHAETCTFLAWEGNFGCNRAEAGMQRLRRVPGEACAEAGLTPQNTVRCQPYRCQPTLILYRRFTHLANLK